MIDSFELQVESDEPIISYQHKNAMFTLRKNRRDAMERGYLFSSARAAMITIAYVYNLEVNGETIL